MLREGKGRRKTETAGDREAEARRDLATEGLEGLMEWVVRERRRGGRHGGLESPPHPDGSRGRNAAPTGAQNGR